MNPVETGTGLKLNISESDNALDLGLAMQVASYFRLTDQKAAKIIDQVKKSVAGWRRLAEKYKISKAEQAIMAKAFWAE
jgi:serine/threonine-protein kinase HipA